MARNTVGGDPRCLSKMMDEMIEHLYLTFYNKISGTSLDQWIPRYLDRCRELIHNAISDGAIWETEYINGEVVNEAWILHHFEFQTFRILVFLMTLPSLPRDLEMKHADCTDLHMISNGHFTRVIYVATA